MTFEFDGDAFERYVREQATDLVHARAAELTEGFDELRKTHAGSPLDEVKDGVTAIFHRLGGSVADPELTEYATAIQQNQRVEAKWDGTFDA